MERVRAWFELVPPEVARKTDDLLDMVDAMRADDVDVVEGVGDAEAGPVDDGVHFAFRPGLVDDAGLGDLGENALPGLEEGSDVLNQAMEWLGGLFGSGKDS